MGRLATGALGAPLRMIIRMPAWLRLWSFNGLLAGLAALLFFGFLMGQDAFGSPVHVPWYVMAVAFFAAELKVIEVHFRRESHAFSLTEVPAVIGLFFLSPNEYLLALLSARPVALLLSSRQAPVKLVFNLANYFLLAVVTITVFRAWRRAGGARADRLSRGLRSHRFANGRRGGEHRTGDHPLRWRAAVQEAAGHARSSARSRWPTPASPCWP